MLSIFYNDIVLLYCSRNYEKRDTKSVWLTRGDKTLHSPSNRKLYLLLNLLILTLQIILHLVNKHEINMHLLYYTQITV